jgi:hypothetical protein
VAPSTDERTWTKWIVWPSIDVVNCGNVFKSACCAGQSNALAQWSASFRAYETGTPRLQSSTTSDGQRVLAIRATRSSTSACGTPIVNGVICIDGSSIRWQAHQSRKSQPCLERKRQS